MEGVEWNGERAKEKDGGVEGWRDREERGEGEGKGAGRGWGEGARGE